ncbi:hypothetical protein HaloA020_07630 [Halomonas sp. A020]|uniref:hypothetical protein n=1 Tax=Halomonas sp. A020 TaxID=2717374 RepID=UPI0024924E3B|nr:hypothetical protein [Halomonas sp. A020]BCB60062.1 hypothetical protein HaloA020_07630 [Halomonas sp. A020]
MSEKINLPSSSFDELVKIIKGYSHASKGASLDEIAKLTGLNKFAISGNNKFLSDIELIEGGRAKSITDLGTKLARAIEHSQVQDAKKCWSDAVSSNEGVSRLVTVVRIKGGMSLEELAAHILYVSGQGNNAKNRAGSRTVVEILIQSGLLESVDGTLKVATPSNEHLAESEDSEEMGKVVESAAKQHGSESEGKPDSLPPEINLTGLTTPPQIAINIQLHLPETDNAEVYEKLFKALKDNLLSGNN